MRTGLLGGTFDPPHRGHLHVARVAQRALELDRVLFAPCQWQPLKEPRPTASAFHRAAMVALAVAARSDWALEVSELERPGPSYTVETLLELSRRWPQDEFVLILGEDSHGSLGGWHRVGELSGLCSVAVVPRTAEGAAAAPEGPVEARWLSATPFPASSTLVREHLAAGVSVAHLLPASVEAYIRKEALYGCPPPGGRRETGRPK